MTINKLTQTALRAAKQTHKPYKLSDGGGLYLLVNPSGALWWRFKYQFEGREKLLSVGVHPHVSLQQARAFGDEAKKAVANGVDPSAKRQAEETSTANTFEAVAREWLGRGFLRIEIDHFVPLLAPIVQVLKLPDEQDLMDVGNQAIPRRCIARVALGLEQRDIIDKRLLAASDHQPAKEISGIRRERNGREHIGAVNQE
jgi:hypothetical protein